MEIPSEVFDEAKAIAKYIAPHLAATSRNVLKEWRRKRRLRGEIKRVLNEATHWPVRKAISIVTLQSTDASKDMPLVGIREDGQISFLLGLLWHAPFPARNVSLKLSAHLVRSNSPFRLPEVEYAIDEPITGANIGPKWLEQGSVTRWRARARPLKSVELWKERYLPCNGLHGRHSLFLEVDRIDVTLFGPWQEQAQQRFSEGPMKLCLPCYLRDESRGDEACMPCLPTNPPVCPAMMAERESVGQAARAGLLSRRGINPSSCRGRWRRRSECSGRPRRSASGRIRVQ